MLLIDLQTRAPGRQMHYNALAKNKTTVEFYQMILLYDLFFRQIDIDWYCFSFKSFAPPDPNQCDHSMIISKNNKTPLTIFMVRMLQ